jgi:hypothetical protein
MGPVMFEVGLFFFVVMFYFTIGYYYRPRYGILLSLAGVLLYFLGLALNMGIPLRFALLMVPILLMMQKNRVTNLEFDKTRVYCPKCGWPNEPDAEFCRGIGCAEPIEKGPDTSKWTYYFPPWLFVFIAASVLLGIMLFETVRPIKFLVFLAYGTWPALVFLIILIFFYRKLR